MLFSITAHAQTSTGGAAAGVPVNAPPSVPLNAAPANAADSLETPKGKDIASTAVGTSATGTTVGNLFTSFEFLLSIAILFFGIIVIGLEVYLSSKKIIKPDHIFKIIILTLVIIGSVVLVVAGYTNNQITGVLGILGSISGYMLGKMDAASPVHKPEAAETDNATEKTEAYATQPQ